MEDEAILRLNLRKALEKKGFEGDEAASVEEAIEKVAETHFDVVVTDYHLKTKQTGICLIEYLKEINYRAPVILMSGDRIEKIWPMAEKLGAFAFLAKPFALPKFLDVTRQAMGEAATINMHS